MHDPKPHAHPNPPLTAGSPGEAAELISAALVEIAAECVLLVSLGHESPEDVSDYPPVINLAYRFSGYNPMVEEEYRPENAQLATRRVREILSGDPLPVQVSVTCKFWPTRFGPSTYMLSAEAWLTPAGRWVIRRHRPFDRAAARSKLEAFVRACSATVGHAKFNLYIDCDLTPFSWHEVEEEQAVRCAVEELDQCSEYLIVEVSHGSRRAVANIAHHSEEQWVFVEGHPPHAESLVVEWDF